MTLQCPACGLEITSKGPQTIQAVMWLHFDCDHQVLYRDFFNPNLQGHWLDRLMQAYTLHLMNQVGETEQWPPF